MNTVRFLIRLLIKVPATPFVVIGMLLFCVIGSGVIFFSWLYNDNYINTVDHEIDKSIIRDKFTFLKKWFTTI